ncbi:MAG: YcdB/YcdC domain-containing protein [Desulfitobacterium sp.]
MSKKLRKLAIPMAVALLVQGTLPASIMAAELSVKPMSVMETIAVPTQVKVTLEDAIKIVKKNFTVPVAFTEFTSGYNNYNGRQTWSLFWNSKEESGGSFNAQVDVDTGEIIYMNSWNNINPANQGSVPQYTYEEAQVIAEKLVESILGDRFNQLELKPENTQIIPVVDYGYTTYTVQWQRVVNGVPFPSNGVSIQVNAYDGTVTSYSFNWSKESIPSLTGVIGETKVREAFVNHKLLELQYFLSPGVRPLDSKMADAKKSALLVYQLNNKSFNGMIDAKTGEPLKLNSGEWLQDLTLDAIGGLGGMAKSAAENAITPEEQKEVDNNAKLLSQEKAVESVKKWVEIPEGLTLRSANLGRQGDLDQKQVWSFDWNSEDSTEGYNAVYARVDAATGEVMGFNVYSSTQHPKGADALNRVGAKAVADAFLKKIQPNRLQQVEYLENLDNGQKYPEDQPSHDFRYQRLVNGVAVPGNGFSVTVDRNSKKVMAFDMNFSDVNFPSASVAMSQKQGEDTFLQKRALELKYVQINKNGQLSDILIVYQPKIENNNMVSNLMDAKTGEFLDWQGKPIKEQPRPYNFSDSAGSFAEEEIKLLGQAGAFGEYDNEFRPTENVTVESLLRAMFVAKNGAWSYQGMTDEELLKQAKELGWLKESLSLNDQVSRELHAKLVIRMLQLEKIAQMEELFQNPYEDSTAFSAGSLGYIALTKGLDVMNIEGSKFDPTKKVTREEAAYTLVKSLRANR